MRNNTTVALHKKKFIFFMLYKGVKGVYGITKI